MYNASGNEVFCSITQNQQQVKYSAICALVQALQKMRLTDEPGQDVEDFGNKMSEMAGRINVTGSATIELSTLVSTAFMDWKVLDFHLKDTWLHNLVDRNLKSLYAYEIIWNLNTKLWYLNDQGLWSFPEIKKVDMEGDLDGLNMSINNLEEY